jgi:cardiolipin synthase
MILFDDTRDGEFFSIFNPGAGDISVGNWSLSDGEGSLILPISCHIAPNRMLTIARNATRFHEQNNRIPDLSIMPSSLQPSKPTVRGSFRLANDGDELVLMDCSGGTIDAVAFGTSARTADLGTHWHGPPIPSPGRSRILVRQSNIDTDSASDWLALRDYRPGQSNFDPVADRSPVTVLVLPEHSNLIIDAIGSARLSVLICSYEFDSLLVSSTIIGLLGKGVSVKILLEGCPAGGISNRSKALLPILEDAGAKISFAQPSSEKDLPRRYSYVHAKYIVIDGRTSIVLSENLVSNVFDAELGHGNRGWAAILDSLSIASALTELFEFDADPRFPDVHSGTDAISSRMMDINLSAATRPHRVVGQEPISATCESELFIFPDCTGAGTAIDGLITEAKDSIYAEIFYADAVWKTPMLGEVTSPILGASAALVGRSMGSYICFDNNSLFSGTENRNIRAIDMLSAVVKRNDAKTLIGFPPGRAPFDILHNKGMVLDHRLSWISSVNWNYESVCANREIGLLIDDGSVAGFFERNVKLDMLGEEDPPVISPELKLSEDGSKWSVYMSGSSDDSGLKSVTFTSSDGSRSRWTYNLNLSDRDIRLDVKIIDLWGNEASGRILIFPTGSSLTGWQPVAFLSSGMTLSMISFAGIGAILVSYIRKRIGRSGDAGTSRSSAGSNRIYGCSSNRLGDDDKGLHPQRRLQGRGHHSRIPQRSLPDFILPHGLSILARRLSRRRRRGRDSRLRDGCDVRRPPV